MIHQWELHEHRLTEDGGWADWHCPRCGKSIIVSPTMNPNKDDRSWKWQGVLECDELIVKSIMVS